MCGIVGYSGRRPAVDILLKGLKRLEYRGYDSAGVAFFNEGKLVVKKSEGRLENVERLVTSGKDEYVGVHCGIGHTRWATHGKPTTQNAHPHRAGHVVIVHNGIIENYQDIRNQLIVRGHLPQSETDSELFGFLVLEEMDKGLGLVEAVRNSFRELEGNCSVVVMSEREPGVVVGVRNGSPLVAAVDPEGGAMLASDAQPILEYSRDVIFLENGDVAVGTAAGIQIFDLETGKPVERKVSTLDWSADKLDKQGYPHYMLKEIHEQPHALVDTLNAVIDRAKADAFSLAPHPGVDLLRSAKRLVFVAMGTSRHAAIVGKYWLERWGNIPVSIEYASEFRYGTPVIEPGTVVVGVSQSGETADTLAALREMKKKGFATIAVTNVRGSTMAREVDAVFYTAAGPEISVAATKTFSAQMMMFLAWAGYLWQIRSNQGENSFQDALKSQTLLQGIAHLPHQLEEYIRRDGEAAKAIRAAAHAMADLHGLFFIGRGLSFPISLEAALKVKEISYIHAEGYAAGELKHGPIAMIDSSMGVIVIAPQDAWREKTISSLEEVKARGAQTVGIGAADDQKLKSLCDHWIPLPPSTGLESMRDVEEALSPFLTAPVIQLLSYEMALKKGTDVDKPRNLAKSVTVE